MQCHACGISLPAGASICPRCGALTPSSSSAYDAIPYIEAQAYMEQATPSTPPASSTTVQKTELLPEASKSIATYPEQKAQQSQRVPGWMTALLILLSLLLILGGISSVVYAVNFRPADLHAQATAVAQNFLTVEVRGTVQANSYATATAAAMTPEQVYQQATSGIPVINDPLKDDSGNVWYHYDGSKHKDLCNFHAGAYHIQLPIQGGASCVGYGVQLNNLAFQVQVKIIEGLAGGLKFRLNESSADTTSYVFGITIDGSYILNISHLQQTKTLKSGISTAIMTGLGQTNLLTAIALNNHIYLYINGQFVDSAIDSTYPSGEIALVAASSTGVLDVAFNNVKVWEL